MYLIFFDFVKEASFDMTDIEFFPKNFFVSWRYFIQLEIAEKQANDLKRS